MIIANRNILDKLKIVQGDITKLKIDAIVNAANKLLLGGGGVDGAIHRAAGPELLNYCKTIGGCPTGQAVISPGYNLPARYVIHTVGPVYKGRKKDKVLLANCYKNSLNLAADNNLTSIAFPAVSCGVYGYPIEEACSIAVNTVCNFLKNSTKINIVIFVLFSLKHCKVYTDYISKCHNL